MKIIITILHVIMATLAVWRITELLTIDRITSKIRRKFNTYLLSCPRCLSVWAGCFVAVVFYFVPWLNWPFAFAWLYLWQLESIQARNFEKNGKQFRIQLFENGKYTFRNDLNPDELNEVMKKIYPSVPQVKEQLRPTGVIN